MCREHTPKMTFVSPLAADSTANGDTNVIIGDGAVSNLDLLPGP